MKKTEALVKSLLKIANKLDSVGLVSEADELDKVASFLAKNAADSWIPQENLSESKMWVGGDAPSPGLEWNAHVVGSFIRSLAKGKVPYQLKAMINELKGKASYGPALQTVSAQFQTLQNDGWRMEWQEVKKIANRIKTSLEIIMRELTKEGNDDGPEFDAAEGMLSQLMIAMSSAEESIKKGYNTKTYDDGKGNGITMTMGGPGGIEYKLRDDSMLEKAQEIVEKL